jgi:hypothetical protein
MPLASSMKNYRFKTLPDIFVSKGGWSGTFYVESELTNIFNPQLRYLFWH